MVLVDTSAWVGHLRSADSRLASLLEDGEVVCHPFILGELACGHLPNRADTLRSLGELPQICVATYEEVMNLIATRRLMGIGLGFIDVHLLASARIYDLPILTRDLPLKRAAMALGVLYSA